MNTFNIFTINDGVATFRREIIITGRFVSYPFVREVITKDKTSYFEVMNESKKVVFITDEQGISSLFGGAYAEA